MKDGRCQSENCLVIIAAGDKEVRYVGQLKGNDVHGNGRLVWKNGTEYTGDWKDDKRTGKGTFIWVNRDEKKYIGEVKDGKFHGSGVMFYTNGDKYSGSLADGKRHGKGGYTFKDGTAYKGIWENDKRIQLFPRLRDFLFL